MMMWNQGGRDYVDKLEIRATCLRRLKTPASWIELEDTGYVPE
jgi:hypothetical protein